ncbi:MAG: hypothetical protein RBU30_01525 [Polyangia bacterium]|nr:hypothetical protein [Polyangia bacterium]
MLPVFLILVPSGLAAAPAVGPVAPRAPRPRAAQVQPDAAQARRQLEEVRAGLARLDSHLDQVKDLHIRLARLAQVVDRLERSAQAPADLEREISRLRRDLEALAGRVEEGRLEVSRVRAFVRHGGSRQGGGAGYDGGFFLASRGGGYRLQVNGLVQSRFQVGQVTGPESLQPAEPVHLLGFDIPTGLLVLAGHMFSPRFQYRIEMEFGPSGIEARDLAFHYRPCPYVGVTFGQLPVQFSQQMYHYPYEILFADTSVASSYYGPGYDLGVRLHFYQWGDRVFEELSVLNGGGLGAISNDNVDLLYQIRAGVLPLGAVPDEEGDFRRGARPPRFRLAGGYFFMPMPTGRDLDGKEGVDVSWVHQAAAEISFWWRGFHLNGELYYRYEDRGRAVTQLPVPERRRSHRLGGFGQAAYFIRPIRLALAGRYSYAEPVSFWRRKPEALVPGWSSPFGLAPSASLEGHGQPEAVQEATAGLIFFALRGHLKLVLSYTWLYEKGYALEGRPTTPSRQGHLVTLLGQARF